MQKLEILKIILFHSFAGSVRVRGAYQFPQTKPIKVNILV
jgi:hypothetical protein